MTFLRTPGKEEGKEEWFCQEPRKGKDQILCSLWDRLNPGREKTGCFLGSRQIMGIIMICGL